MISARKVLIQSIVFSIFACVALFCFCGIAAGIYMATVGEHPFLGGIISFIALVSMIFIIVFGMNLWEDIPE